MCCLEFTEAALPEVHTGAEGEAEACLIGGTGIDDPSLMLKVGLALAGVDEDGVFCVVEDEKREQTNKLRATIQTEE